jgi:hypothetical protein
LTAGEFQRSSVGVEMFDSAEAQRVTLRARAVRRLEKSGRLLHVRTAIVGGRGDLSIEFKVRIKQNLMVDLGFGE